MKKEIMPSTGYYSNIQRIGRPDVVLDQRAKYTFNGEDFARAMNEKKLIKSTKEVEIIGPITVESELM